MLYFPLHESYLIKFERFQRRNLSTFSDILEKIDSGLSLTLYSTLFSSLVFTTLAFFLSCKGKRMV